MTNKERADHFKQIYINALVNEVRSLWYESEWEVAENQTKSVLGFFPYTDGGCRYIGTLSNVEDMHRGSIGEWANKQRAFAHSDALVYGSEDTEEYMEAYDEWMATSQLGIKFRFIFYDHISVSNTNSEYRRTTDKPYIVIDLFADPSEYSTNEGTFGDCEFCFELDRLTEEIVRGAAKRQVTYYKEVMLGL